MTTAGRFDHLRHGALELLADGNSCQSVAQLLGVPVNVVMRWRDEPVPPRPDTQAVLASLGAQGRPIGFRTTLTHASRLRTRILGFALLAFDVSAVAIDLATWLREGGARSGGAATLLANGVIIVASAVFWLAVSRPALVLGPSGISVPGLFGRKTMTYAELRDWWLVLHVLREGEDDEVVGRLLTLHHRRAGTRPFEVFIRDSEPFDPLLLERLELVKQANRGEHLLTPMGSISTA